MKIKDSLCKKALELENEIEFLKSINKPYSKELTTLKKAYSILKNLKEKNTKSHWYAARIFLQVNKLNDILAANSFPTIQETEEEMEAAAI